MSELQNLLVSLVNDYTLQEDERINIILENYDITLCDAEYILELYRGAL